MTAKEYLNQAYRISELIASNARQIQKLKDSAVNISIGSFESKVQGGKTTGFAEAVEKIADLQAEINADTVKMVALLAEIRQTINQVENADERLVLTLRYLEFQKWDKIADKMGYTTRQVTRIHGCALKKLGNF